MGLVCEKCRIGEAEITGVDELEIAVEQQMGDMIQTREIMLELTRSSAVRVLNSVESGILHYFTQSYANI